jgi:hypothetical protein
VLWPVSQNFYDHLQILSVFSNAFSPINEDKEVSVWLPAYHSLQAMLVWERLSSRKRPEMKIGNLRFRTFSKITARQERDCLSRYAGLVPPETLSSGVKQNMDLQRLSTTSNTTIHNVKLPSPARGKLSWAVETECSPRRCRGRRRRRDNDKQETRTETNTLEEFGTVLCHNTDILCQRR